MARVLCSNPKCPGKKGKTLTKLYNAYIFKRRKWVAVAGYCVKCGHIEVYRRYRKGVSS